MVSHYAWDPGGERSSAWEGEQLSRTACALQSKKRGLSLEDKRDKILEVFHDSADVFQLKVRRRVLCVLWCW